MDDATTADRVESLFAGVSMPTFKTEAGATDIDARPRFADCCVPLDFEDDDSDIAVLEFGFDKADLITVPSRLFRLQQKSRLTQLLDNLAQTSLASDNEKTMAVSATGGFDPPNPQNVSAHSRVSKECAGDSQATVTTSMVIEAPACITDTPILTSTPLPKTLETIIPNNSNPSTTEPAYIFDTEGTNQIDGEQDILYHSYPNVVGRPVRRTIADDDNDVIVFARKEITSVRDGMPKGDQSSATLIPPPPNPSKSTFVGTEDDREPNTLYHPYPDAAGGAARPR